MRKVRGITRWKWLGVLSLFCCSFAAAVGQLQIERIPIPLRSFESTALFDGAVWNGSVVLVGAAGTIIRATPDLQQWEVQRLGESVTLRSIAVLSANVAIAIAAEGTGFRSTDGGETWAPLSLPTAVPLRQVRGEGQVVVAMAEQSVVLLSFDQGETWQQRMLPFAISLFDLAVRDSVIAVVGDSATVAISTDLGNTWQRTVLAAPDLTLRSVAQNGDSTIVVVGDRGRAFFSANLGQQWDTLVLEGAGRLSSVAFATASQGWIAEQSQEADTVRLWYTRDGGKHWSRDARPVVHNPGCSTLTLERLLPAGSALIAMGACEDAGIAGTGKPQPGAAWEWKLWGKPSKATVITGGRVVHCNQIQLVVGEPASPRILVYDREVDQWQVAATLPVVAYRGETSDGLPFNGARAGRGILQGHQQMIQSVDALSTVWVSKDTGRSWQTVSLDGLTVIRSFPYGRSGFGIIGAQGMSPATLIRITQDGGESWRTLLDLRGSGMRIDAAQFPTEQMGWIAVWNGQQMELWQTADGGQQWTKQVLNILFHRADADTVLQQRVHRLFAYNRQQLDMLLGGVIQQGGSARGYALGLWSSTDGGKSWQLRWWLDQIDPSWQLSLQPPIIEFVGQDRRAKAALVATAAQVPRLLYSEDGLVWKVHRLESQQPWEYHLIDFQAGCLCMTANGIRFGQGAEMWMVRFPNVTTVPQEGQPSFPIAIVSPSQGVLSLFLAPAQQRKVVSVEIYTLYGALIQRQPGFTARLPLPSLPAGHYWCVVRFTDRIVSLPFWIR